MRNTMIVMSALALTAAAPVAAQSTDNTLNATTEPAANTDAAGIDNAIVTTDPAMAGTANDLTAAPVTLDQPVEMAEAEPAPAKRGGFPWGAVGLLGLLGLISRKSR